MSAGGLESPRRLRRQDVTAGFRSGATAQDAVILGYYAITPATYSRDDAPQGLNHRS